MFDASSHDRSSLGHGRHGPVLERRDAYVHGLRRFRIVANRKYKLALLALFRHANAFNRVDLNRIEVHEVFENLCIALLATNPARSGGRQDCSTRWVSVYPVFQ